MRPVEHTNDSIVAAGKAIQADGRNVTGFALRQVLGGGNHARLKQIWDAHLSELAGAASEPVAALPPEVADEVAVVSQALAERLGALALGLNAKAVKAAERRVQEVMGVAAEQQSQANRELADAAQAVESLETEVEAAADRVREASLCHRTRTSQNIRDRLRRQAVYGPTHFLLESRQTQRIAAVP